VKEEPRLRVGELGKRDSQNSSQPKDYFRRLETKLFVELLEKYSHEKITIELLSHLLGTRRALPGTQGTLELEGAQK